VTGLSGREIRRWRRFWRELARTPERRKQTLKLLVLGSTPSGLTTFSQRNNQVSQVDAPQPAALTPTLTPTGQKIRKVSGA
jgi:hypothetical protein